MSHFRSDFPFFTNADQQNLVYVDQAATSQKSEAVLQAMDRHDRSAHANVHRSLNPLAEQATAAFESTRGQVSRFINAPDTREVIFTSGTTAGINLVARTWGDVNMEAGDRIVLSISEHHANVVPWLQLAERRQLEIDWIGLTPDGRWDLAQAADLIAKPRTKLVGLGLVSNVLGVINPVAEVTAMAKAVGAVVVVDAAQAVAHMSVDVQALGCDFLAFSGHKMYGPTGVGVLWGRRQLLESIPPFLGGGDMVTSVSTTGYTLNELPYKFEAGTPAITEVIGLAAAVNYLQSLSWSAIQKHEHELCSYLMAQLSQIPEVTVLAGSVPVVDRVPLASFTVVGVHAHDVVDLLGQQGIMARAGHHCAHPLHQALGAPASTRFSLGLPNNMSDIDQTVAALRTVIARFQ